MHVLALDFGSSCGFAIGRPGIAPISGVWNLRPVPSESPGMRYIRLLARLNEVHRADPAISLIVMEKAHMRGAAATTYAHGYQTHVQSWVDSRKLDRPGLALDYTDVHTATLKKWATGSGRASKDDMVRIGRERFKVTTLDDNEIDALWLLDYALANLADTRKQALSGASPTPREQEIRAAAQEGEDDL